jgi:DNA polymerase
VTRSLAEEAAEVLAAARAALGEWVEEGVDRMPATEEAAKPAVESRTLEAVHAELGECTRCPLCEGRTQIVFGDGNPHADLLFIGEGPGEQEDLRGLPFVGRAGELLTRMIEKGLGIARSEVYICNIFWTVRSMQSSPGSSSLSASPRRACCSAATSRSPECGEPGTSTGAFR